MRKATNIPIVPKKRSRAAVLNLSSLPDARKTEQPFSFSPQLATLAKEVPKGNSWIHEIKYDGFRMICFVADGKVRMVSRNGLDWTSRFGKIAEAVCSLPTKKGILDGEVVVFRKDGTTDFNALQNFVEGTPAVISYVVYDLPYCEGYDLTRSPLIERKWLLEKLLKDRSIKEKILTYSEHVQGNGEAFFKAASEHELEDIVSKRLTSTYYQGRTRSWLKLKFTKADEFLILGFTKVKDSYRNFSGLLLGYYHVGNRLAYAGRVGTGFSDQALITIGRKLEKIVKLEPTFRKLQDVSRHEEVYWVKPELVAEVNYCSWTKDGLLRHSSFKGLREDKMPIHVTGSPSTDPFPLRQQERKLGHSTHPLRWSLPYSRRLPSKSSAICLKICS